MMPLTSPAKRAHQHADRPSPPDRKPVLEAERHGRRAEPVIEPTEMSISPVMMIRVMASATIATGMAPAMAIEMFDAGEEIVAKLLRQAGERAVADAEHAGGGTLSHARSRSGERLNPAIDFIARPSASNGRATPLVRSSARGGRAGCRT